MKILITGGTGMLGSSIVDVFERETDHSLYSYGSKEMDVANYEQCRMVFNEIEPDIVLHLAAKTNVDQCETEVDSTYKVNVIGTWNIASLCKMFDTTMVFISTDGVFDGRKGTYYTEYDSPNPVTVYGESKVEGEKIVTNLLDKYFILRAGWMFGGAEKDSKFVGKILELAQKNDDLSAVADKIGSPIYTKDLAVFIKDEILNDQRYGLYHVCNEGMCSRFEFARKIVEFARLNDVQVHPVDSSKFITIAERPPMTPMKNFNIILQDRKNLRNWEDALEEYINNFFLEK